MQQFKIIGCAKHPICRELYKPLQKNRCVAIITIYERMFRRLRFVELRYIMMKLSPPAIYVLDKLTASSYQAYLVGGCVRDCLMGAAAKDTDITTSALPEEVKSVFSEDRIIETGIKHGTLTVIAKGKPVEITTFRTEGAYSDKRHPDKVNFTADVKDDLSRRDFTMNAIAYNPQEGFIDLFGGINDIKNKTIRCVGYPRNRFEEDALRILRAVRFSSVLGFEIEQRTKRALFDCKEELTHISKERLASELSLTVCGDNIKNVIIEYAPILGTFIEQFSNMINFSRHNPHHKYDLLTHVANMTSELPPVLHLRLTGLLHDIGKPACFSRGENGIGHFYGHEKLGAEMADDILRDLKFDNATRNKVVTLIRYHMYPLTNDEKIIKKLLSKIGEEMFFELIQIKKADVSAHVQAHLPNKAFFDEIAFHAASIISSKECFCLKTLAINGKDVEKLGFEGKNIGKVLDMLLDKVIKSEIENDYEMLMREAFEISRSRTELL